MHFYLSIILWHLVAKKKKNFIKWKFQVKMNIVFCTNTDAQFILNSNKQCSLKNHVSFQQQDYCRISEKKHLVCKYWDWSKTFFSNQLTNSNTSYFDLLITSVLHWDISWESCPVEIMNEEMTMDKTLQPTESCPPFLLLSSSLIHKNRFLTTQVATPYLLEETDTQWFLHYQQECTVWLKIKKKYNTNW